MNSLGLLLLQLLNLYFYLVLAMVILSWLVNFNIVNTRNRLVYLIEDFLRKITEPVLRPIRQVLPSIGGVDISPVILIFLIMFAQNLIREYWFGYF